MLSTGICNAALLRLLTSSQGDSGMKLNVTFIAFGSDPSLVIADIQYCAGCELIQQADRGFTYNNIYLESGM